MAIVAMLTGLIIMVGVVFGSANTAYAATLTPADERYHVAFPYNDMEYYVGVAGLDASGNKYYCIEAGKLSDYVIGPTTVLASDENARRMAWILDRYRDTDAATHAAIGIIVAVLNQLLIRSGREDQAMMTTLAGLVVVLSILVKQISALFVTIKSLFAL